MRNPFTAFIVRRRLKRALAPTPEFLSRSEARFLSLIPSAPARHARQGALLARVSTATAVVAALLVSTSAYANYQNVGVGSPLYPLKRSYEQVELAVAPATSAPALHVRFAERRLAEIEDVRTKNPVSPAISSLTNDFHTELELSVRGVSAIVATNQPAPGAGEGGEGTVETTATPALMAAPRTFSEGEDNETATTSPSRRGKERAPFAASMAATSTGTSTPAQTAPSGDERGPENASSTTGKRRSFWPAWPTSKLEPLCTSLSALVDDDAPEAKSFANENPEAVSQLKSDCAGTDGSATRTGAAQEVRGWSGKNDSGDAPKPERTRRGDDQRDSGD